MTANIRGFTANYSFKLINFDTPRWHTLEYSNWQQLDALLGGAGIVPVRGEWTNSTEYIAGQRVFDLSNGLIYRAIVTHTSSDPEDSPTFAEERSEHPGLWQTVLLSTPFYRGAWQPDTMYAIGDLVAVNDYAYYLCTGSHIGGPTFIADPYWQLVFDATQVVTDATDARDIAVASADAAADSAASALDSKNQAADAVYASVAASSAARTAADEARADAILAVDSASAAALSEASASDSAISATASAASATVSAAEAALQAAALRGTSLTSHTIFTGSKVFVTQAGKQFNPGNFMMVCNTAAPTVNWMLGQVTAYSGTSLTLNVIMISPATGTFADWQLYISGAQGAGGVIWKGPWSGATTYAVNDIVSSNGNSYICKAAHTNQAPPNAAYWDMMAAGGAAGIADDSITPIKLDAGTPPKQLAFRDRLNLVSRAGDTMVGDLVIDKNAPNLHLNVADPASYASVQFKEGGVAKALINYIGSAWASPTSRRGVLEIYNTTGSLSFLASGTERMRIDGTTGYVGIGAATPSSILHVAASDAVVGPSLASSLILQNINLTAGNSNSIVFATKDSGNTNFVHGAWISANYTARGSGVVTATLGFYTSNAASAPTERMRIEANGNVSMLSDLLISPSAAGANARIWLNAPAGQVPVIIGQQGGVLKWVEYLANGPNGDYSLQRYNDAGAAIDTPFNIQRLGTVMTLTVDPTVIKDNPSLILNKTGLPGARLVGQYAGKNRWIVNLANNSAESGSNVGSDLTITPYDDAGTGALPTAFTLKRSDQSATFGGNAVVTKSLPQLILNDTGTSGTGIQAQRNGVSRWWLGLTDGTAESGSNVGNDLYLHSYSDAGAAAFQVFRIPRNSGEVTFYQNMKFRIGTSGAGAWYDGSGTQPGRFFAGTNNADTWRVYTTGIPGDAFAIAGATGDVTIARNLVINGALSTVGTIWGGNQNMSGTVAAAAFSASSTVTASGYFLCTGGAIYSRAANSSANAAFTMQNEGGAAMGHLYWNRPAASIDVQHNDTNAIQLMTGGGVYLGQGWYGRSGVGGGTSGYRNNFVWTAPLQFWTENTYVGNVSITSDYRTKKDVVNLDSMWDKVKSLRPIKYTQATFQPEATKALYAKEAITEAKLAQERGDKDFKPRDIPPPLFQADDIERWGFIAHELQDALLPSAATGVKDDPVAVQSPNLAPLVAALTKALQEAMARIEALEART